MADLDSYLETLRDKPAAPGGRPSGASRTTRRPRTTGQAQQAAAPPQGFTPSQWNQLVSLGRTNPALQNLISQFTAAQAKPQQPQAWRRQNPTDTNQLLRQLSFNAGEVGMPGGYVGGVQMPAYGTGLPAINNPNMATYGQTPGYGEATFYRQSMQGGMAPLSAASPLGVPEGWNPGGSTAGLQKQLADYLSKLNSAGGSGGTGMIYRTGSLTKEIPANHPWARMFGWVNDVKQKSDNKQGPNAGPPAAGPPMPGDWANTGPGGTPITPPFGSM